MEVTVRQPKTRQLGLFETIDPPQAMPAAIEQEVFGVLVQLIELMIPVMEAEAADEQNLH